MDENRVEGAARNFGGKAQEGRPWPCHRQCANAGGQAADTVREKASSFDKALPHTIETQPYTSALMALGIGWLLGFCIGHYEPTR